MVLHLEERDLKSLAEAGDLAAIGEVIDRVEGKGDGTFDSSVRATRDGGCVALLGVLAQRGCPVNFAEVLMRRIRVQGVFVGSRVELERCLAFVASHAIAPMIDRIFEGLTSARHAFAYLLGGRHFGKIVIRIADS
jgi:D-arabinose 1-dehydrogenase-like Zn-dependent alcohol dehydrogenase